MGPVTVDLARWLGQQLDEDERIARAVEDRSAPWDGQWMADGNSAVRTLNGHVLFYRHDERPLKPGLTEHVAEWDPARVLQEIDAKRRIVDAYLPPGSDPHPGLPCTSDPENDPDGELWTASLPWPDEPCVRHLEASKRLLHNSYVLRLLALPYADRPGYRDDWRL